MKIIKFKKLRDDFVVPKKATDNSACFDIYATSEIEFKVTPFNKYIHVYHLGFSTELPNGFHVKIYPRSSIRNKNCQLINSVGVIDQDYRGEWQVTFVSDSGFQPYDKGERIAQFEMVKTQDEILFEAVNDLSQTVRGEGGHGSTGQ